jgi:transposase
MNRLEELEQLARRDPLEMARTHWQTEQRLAQAQQQLSEALAHIAQLKRQLFGSKADKLSPEQEQALQEVVQDLAEAAQRPGPVSQQVLAEKTPPRPRHRLPPQIETQEIILEPADKICPHTGKDKRRIGQEVTTEYDLIPEKLICRRIVRPKYAPCECGQCGMSIAPLPPRLIPQSRLGLGLAVHILLSRFDDHVAYYTLERIFRERHGVIIPRQQMVQWVEAIAFLLQPICRLMWEQMLAGGYLQIDETPVRVLDPELKGRSARGYLWFYAVPHQDVILEFREGRGQEGLKEKLQNFSGTIQTDAYEVYNAFRRTLPAIKRIGCLAHARRKFYQAALEGSRAALWFISQIRHLYVIEDQARTWEAQARKLWRRQNAPPIWKALKKRALELKADPSCLPQSTLGKAVRYFLNEYTALAGYLRWGHFQIDNNLVENAIRPAVVGRKRWLFIGHPEAGWRSAVIYSILLSCRRRGLNPQDYLQDVLARLPSMKSNEIDQLLPSRWQQSQKTTAAATTG